jgi:hypothetical protein
MTTKSLITKDQAMEKHRDLVNKRDEFIKTAERELAFLNGQIRFLEELLGIEQPQGAPMPDPNGREEVPN